MQYMKENCLSGFTSVPHRLINAPLSLFLVQFFKILERNPSYPHGKERNLPIWLASILLKKSPPMGCKELINLFRTKSISTLKYCVYDEMLKTPFQLLANCCGPSPSA
ncbi:unnamed protein product, partial [Vitis vinifera]|uniref:DNA replication complex GINS protein PSF2 n=1 Tax=Vitis vinifera TaxID=29760 RepID=D7U8R7_VITVI